MVYDQYVDMSGAERNENPLGDLKPIDTFLLPGLDGTGLLFEEFIRHCPYQFLPRIVSYPGERVQTSSELLNQIEQQLSQTSQFIILGESFSGPLAVMAASRRPPGLMAVIMAASFVKSPRSRWLGCLPWEKIFRLKAPDVVVKWLLAGPNAEPALLKRFREAQKKVEAKVLASRLREVLHIDVTKELQSCALPILYLQGLRDRLVGQRSIELIKHLSPNVVVGKINAPHWVLQNKPKDCWEMITSFVEQEVVSDTPLPHQSLKTEGAT